MERRRNGGTSVRCRNCYVEIAKSVSEKRIFTLLCNSSPIALQHANVQRVATVIHFVPLVTHSSPAYEILY
ncbi:MAG: hypothetical protein II541_07795 [Prevotella sp.]|nr:hypothetical protein [Prevotella sp.]